VIQQIVFESIRTDMVGIFYQFDIPWLRFLNVAFPMLVFIIMFIGLTWCFHQALIHRNDEILFEEFSNAGRYNLPNGGT
jgi:hypothetical protein